MGDVKITWHNLPGCAITEVNNEHAASIPFPGGLHDTNREAD